MHNRRWVSDKLWYLCYLPAQVRYEVFCEHLGYSKDTVIAKRKMYLKKFRRGEEVPPRRPEQYIEGEPARNIAERLQAAPVLGEMAVQQLISQQDREALHKRLDEVIDATNINPELVKGFKVSAWDMGYKDNDGEAQTQRLHGIQLVAEARDLQPRWETIRQIEARPLPFMRREQKDRPGNQGTAVIMPDPQIGYRKYQDGTLDPFHDEKAIAIALSVIGEVQPTEVIFLGDLLDLPAFGRFEQSEDYAHTTNHALEYACRLLDTVRSLAGPDCKITILEGNHERRIEKQNKANMLANYGLRQEGSYSNFPVLSVPHLLNLEKRGVEYIEGYPSGKYWLNERLQIIHGHIARSGGSTVNAVVKQEDASTIFGHVHRIEAQYKTQNTFRGARTIGAFTPGCLCRIDGAVPSAKGSTRLDGRPVQNYEQWQQGLAVVEYLKGDGSFSYEQVFINTHENYRTIYRGKSFTPPKPRRKR